MSVEIIAQILFFPSHLVITHAQDEDCAHFKTWLDAFDAFPDSRAFQHNEETLFIGEHNALFVVNTHLPEMQWGYGSVTFTPKGVEFALDSSRRVFWTTIAIGGNA
jgi:hypothetical protein